MGYIWVILGLYIEVYRGYIKGKHSGWWSLCRVKGSGFWVLGFGIEGVGFRVQGLGLLSEQVPHYTGNESKDHQPESTFSVQGSKAQCLSVEDSMKQWTHLGCNKISCAIKPLCYCCLYYLSLSSRPLDLAGGSTF